MDNVWGNRGQFKEANSLVNSKGALLDTVVRAGRKWQVLTESPPLLFLRFRLGSAVPEVLTRNDNLVNKMQKEGSLV